MNRYEVTVEETIRCKATFVVTNAASEEAAIATAKEKLKRCLAASQEMFEALKEARAALHMQRCRCKGEFRCTRCKGLKVVRSAIGSVEDAGR